LINQLEGDRVHWAITADQDSAVKGTIRRIPASDWKEPEVGCGYEVSETVHSMQKTDRAFRLIVKRWVKPRRDLFDEGGYAYHAVGSNWPMEKKSAAEVLEWHNQRGQAENFNKEIKSGFGLEQMPCGQMWANAVYFRLGVIAYNLFIGFKRLPCLGSWAHHTIETFRWKLIQVAGRIVRHAGRVILKLMVGADELALFQRIRRSCSDLSWVT
jgi:hypothetical protein